MHVNIKPARLSSYHNHNDMKSVDWSYQNVLPFHDTNMHRESVVTGEKSTQRGTHISELFKVRRFTFSSACTQLRVPQLPQCRA